MVSSNGGVVQVLPLLLDHVLLLRFRYVSAKMTSDIPLSSYQLNPERFTPSETSAPKRRR